MADKMDERTFSIFQNCSYWQTFIVNYCRLCHSGSSYELPLGNDVQCSDVFIGGCSKCSCTVNASHPDELHIFSSLFHDRTFYAYF